MKKMMLLIVMSFFSLGAQEAIKNALMLQLGTQWPALLYYKVQQADNPEAAMKVVRPLIPDSLWDAGMERVVNRIVQDQFQSEASE